MSRSRFMLVGLLLRLFLSVASMSMAVTTPASGESATRSLRLLALHGSGGSADAFRRTIDRWSDAFQEKGGSRLDITTITAPVENTRDGGFSWWSLPPGVRSFQAERYDGFDRSAKLVIDELAKRSDNFDYIVGHSQGAILLVSLLALNMIPRHPRRGYILNGVAWPNPYTQQLQGLRLSTNSGSDIRFLLITGDGDAINPPAQALRVRQALEAAGGRVQMVRHPGGHSVPTKRDATLERISEWMLASSGEGTDALSLTASL